MLRDVERVGTVGASRRATVPRGRRGSACASSKRATPPEVLYWVGCAAAYDERARKAAESTAKLLQKAGVDFAILGASEACTGDPARRMGNEYVFQAYAAAERRDAERGARDEDRRELPALPQHARQRVPGLRRALRGDAPHAAARRAAARREARAGGERAEITYHDSCYLARHNDVLDEPRELVAAVGKPVEMERSEKRTFCCGAGGAHMWMEERGADQRGARARGDGDRGGDARGRVPFCTVMLDDGVRSMGKRVARRRRVDAARRVDGATRGLMLVGLGHVDLVCRDLERSLAFYAAVFGPLGLEPPTLFDGERGEQIHYLRFPQSAPARSDCGRRRATRSSSCTHPASTTWHSRSRPRPMSTTRTQLLWPPAARCCTHRACGPSTTRTTTRRSSSIRTASASRSRPPRTRGSTAALRPDGRRATTPGTRVRARRAP